jgi:electron transfer flavoprotein alpha subunit
VSNVKRSDPRRPASRMPNGRRRIDLRAAALAAAQSAAVQPPAVNLKPLRLHDEIRAWHMAIAHSDRGRLDDHARQTIAAAGILAGPDTGVVAIVLGDFTGNPAELGCDHICELPDFDAARFQPDAETAAVMGLITQYQAKHVFLPDKLGGDGDLGRRLIACVGQLSGTSTIEIDAHGIGVFWSGVAAIARIPLPRIVLLAPGAVDAHLPFRGCADRTEVVREAPVAPEIYAYCDLGVAQLDAAQVALEEADCIVSGGNGVLKVETLKQLAGVLGAAVGASRVAVDDGRFQRDQQIGASGKTVTASTYIAVGISGAIQHMQGIKDCRHVIAINRDPSAPIIKRADLSIIGDAEDVMLALINEVAVLRRSRNAKEAA